MEYVPKPRGRPVKYLTEEDRRNAIRMQVANYQIKFRAEHRDEINERARARRKQKKAELEIVA